MIEIYQKPLEISFLSFSVKKSSLYRYVDDSCMLIDFKIKYVAGTKPVEKDNSERDAWLTRTTTKSPFCNETSG